MALSVERTANWHRAAASIPKAEVRLASRECRVEKNIL